MLTYITHCGPDYFFLTSHVGLGSVSKTYETNCFYNALVANPDRSSSLFGSDAKFENACYIKQLNQASNTHYGDRERHSLFILSYHRHLVRSISLQFPLFLMTYDMIYLLTQRF